MEVRRRRIAKNKRKVVFRLLLLLFLLLLISAGVVGGVLLLQRQASNTVPLTEMAFSPGNEFVYTGQGFLYVKDNTLCYEDIHNEKNNEKYQIDDANVFLAASGTMRLLYNTGYVRLLSVPYPQKLDGSVVSIKCGASYYAALCSNANGTESIQVFDKTGTQTDHLQYAGELILDYGFYTATNEYLYVIAVSLNSGTPHSTITVYDMTAASTIGLMQLRNQMIEQMHFTNAGIYTVGTNQIIRYELSSNRETGRETVYGWKVMDFDSSGAPTFLLRPRGTDVLGTIKLISMKDSEPTDSTQRLLQVPSGTLDAFLMGNKLVAVTAQGYTSFDKEGKRTGEKVFSTPIETVQKLDSTTLLLTKGATYYTLKVS